MLEVLLSQGRPHHRGYRKYINLHDVQVERHVRNTKTQEQPRLLLESREMIQSEPTMVVIVEDQISTQRTNIQYSQ